MIGLNTRNRHIDERGLKQTVRRIETFRVVN